MQVLSQHCKNRHGHVSAVTALLEICGDVSAVTAVQYKNGHVGSVTALINTYHPMALSAKNLLKALKVSLGAASPQPARMRVAHPQHMHQLAPAQQTEKLEPHTEGHLKAGLIRSQDLRKWR